LGIEWFRDLSVTILAFVTTGVLIFITVLIYLLYRKIKATLQLTQSAAKIAYETIAMVQEGIKPLLPVLAVIKGMQEGFKNIKKNFIDHINKEK
jgi:hypothetical protein